MAETVLYEVDGSAATLTLNRPDRLNAIVPALIEDMEAALDRAQGKHAVHAIRLRGAGRVFCAGYDIDTGSHAMLADEAGAPGDHPVGAAVAEPDAPFSDYGQRPR
jgi:enoyl-CoA hydratase